MVGRHPMPATQQLPLGAITLDPRAQPRLRLDSGVVDEYAEAMKAGAEFPPVVAFHDGEAYWLADGYHRHAAAGSVEAKTIKVEVRKGGVRDAILYAAGANARHGLRRSNEDKRRAVQTLLRDDEWGRWADNEIARRCGVSQPFVSGLRSQVAAAATGEVGETPAAEPQPATRLVRRGRSQYPMDTAKIGKAPARSQAPNGPPSVTSTPLAKPAKGKSKGVFTKKELAAMSAADPSLVDHLEWAASELEEIDPYRLLGLWEGHPDLRERIQEAMLPVLRFAAGVERVTRQLEQLYEQGGELVDLDRAE
jgi:ParB-like chromosome segregation protein Spo0J